eukprot:15359018-Ditylum_brightwellii.AAC.1
MTQFYRTMYGNNKKEAENKVGLGIIVESIECYRCIEKGHKANRCKNPQKKKGEKGKSNTKCGQCGKTGHATNTCFEDPRNAHLVPKWYKKKGGSKNKTEEDKGEAGMMCPELLLMAKEAMTFPTTMELLKDPNVWIGDT